MVSTPSLFDELSLSAIQDAFPSPHPAIGAEQASLFSPRLSADSSPSSSSATKPATIDSAPRPATLSRRLTASSDDQTARGQRKRKRNFTNADRVVHSVIEKQRREAFNERLQHLADMIPELQEMPTSQLFKTVVVNASASYHQRQAKHIETCLDEIGALQQRCANLQQTISALSGSSTGRLDGPSLRSDEFVRAELDIRKDQAALQQAARARASSSTSTTQSALTETSDGQNQVASILASSSRADEPLMHHQHHLPDASLDIPPDLFASSHFEPSSGTNASFTQIAASADDLAALILPGLLPSSSSAMAHSIAPVPFPWESFSPGNFFYRQLLEARERV